MNTITKPEKYFRCSLHKKETLCLTYFPTLHSHTIRSYKQLSEFNYYHLLDIFFCPTFEILPSFVNCPLVVGIHYVKADRQNAARHQRDQTNSRDHVQRIHPYRNQALEACRGRSPLYLMPSCNHINPR